MEKRLLAYQISGQTVGIDLTSWQVDDLNDNEPFVTITNGSTIPNNYVDISSIENWDKFGETCSNDYLSYKEAIKDLILLIGWSNLSNIEKDIGIRYNSYTDPMDAVIYLMTIKGMSQQEAQTFLLLEWHKHHGRLMNSSKQRWYYVKLVVPKYLSFSDSEDLLNSINLLVLAFNDMGRTGINYGDKRDGIMDYIESTNMFFGQGLRESTYTLLTGTWDDFITDVKNVIVHGIYNKYSDIKIE